MRPGLSGIRLLQYSQKHGDQNAGSNGVKFSGTNFGRQTFGSRSTNNCEKLGKSNRAAYSFKGRGILRHIFHKHGGSLLDWKEYHLVLDSPLTENEIV